MRVRIPYAIAVAALTSSFVVAVSSAHGDEVELPSETYGIPTGTLSDGRTYGSGIDSQFGGDAYDLISVIGDTGKIGFIDRVACDKLMEVGSPSEVAAHEAKLQARELSCPVLDVDGVTRIDVFTLGTNKPGLRNNQH